MMTDKNPTTLTWMQKAIALIGRSRSKEKPMTERRAPSCADCGAATIPSTMIHTVRIGGPEEDPSAPLVEAIVKVEIPVYKCVIPQCGCALIGNEGQEVIDKVCKSLLENCYAKYNNR